MEFLHEARAGFLQYWRTLRDTVRPLSGLILLGLVLRYALAVYSSQSDLSGFADTSAVMVYGGGPYTFVNIYPPGWVYLLNLVGRTASLMIPASQFSVPTSLNWLLVARIGTLEPLSLVSPGYALVEKSLLFLFDVGCGLVLYTLLREHPMASVDPRKAFALWFLNPVVVSVSALHGTFDVIATFFALLGMLFLLRRQPLWSGLSLGIGICVKVWPGFLVPLAMAVIWMVLPGSRRARMYGEALFLAGLAGVIALFFWPPGVAQHYFAYTTTGPAVGLIFGGFWIWSFISLPALYGIAPVLVANSAVIYYAVVAIGVLLALWVAWQMLRPRAAEPLSDARLYRSAFIAICGAFSATVIVQPQYLIWIMPFAVVLTLSHRWLWIPFTVISTFPVALYEVGLAGPLYLWQGVAYFTHLVPQSLVLSTVIGSSSYVPGLKPFLSIPVFVALVTMAVWCVYRPRWLRRWLDALA